MLCGDMEVSQVTTKPGYLIDWKYDDTTTTGSFMSNDKATIGTDTSNYTSPSTTMVPEALQSPGNGTKPILHDIIDRRGTRVHQLSSFHNMEVEDAERSMVQGLHGCVYDVNSDTDTSGHHQLTSSDNYMEATTRSMVHGLHVCVYEVDSSSGNHQLNSTDNWEQQQEYHNKHPSTLEMIHPIGLWKN
ncbi:hypothetical protein ACOSP7_027775 [Xanthoceras sorbifolium]